MSESLRRNLFLALCALVLLHTGVHMGVVASNRSWPERKTGNMNWSR